MRERFDKPLTTKDTEDWSDRSDAPEVPARLALDALSMSDEDLARFIILHNLADAEDVAIDNEADERDDNDIGFTHPRTRAKRPATAA